MAIYYFLTFYNIFNYFLKLVLTNSKVRDNIKSTKEKKRQLQKTGGNSNEIGILKL